VFNTVYNSAIKILLVKSMLLILVIIHSCTNSISPPLSCYDYDTMLAIALEKIEVDSTMDVDMDYNYIPSIVLNSFNADIDLYDSRFKDFPVDSAATRIRLDTLCDLESFQSFDGWRFTTFDELMESHQNELVPKFYQVSFPYLSRQSGYVYFIIQCRWHSGYGHGFIFKHHDSKWKFVDDIQLYVN
jgi:hypothetical protein